MKSYEIKHGDQEMAAMMLTLITFDDDILIRLVLASLDAAFDFPTFFTPVFLEGHTFSHFGCFGIDIVLAH